MPQRYSNKQSRVMTHIMHIQHSQPISVSFNNATQHES